MQLANGEGNQPANGEGNQPANGEGNQHACKHTCSGERGGESSCPSRRPGESRPVPRRGESIAAAERRHTWCCGAADVLWRRATPLCPWHEDRDGHQRSSEIIRGHQRSSEVIRGHQRSSEVIRGHQRSSEVIRGHQRSSEVIRAMCALQRSQAHRWRSIAIHGTQLALNWHSIGTHWQAAAFTCRCRGNRCTGPRRARAALRPTLRRG